MPERVAADSVVLIAYHFPPDPAVGSLRAAKVARAFRDAGYPIDVVTARLPGETGTRVTDDPALRVHPVALLLTPRDLYARLKALRRPRGPSPSGGAGDTATGWTPPKRVAGWQRLLGALLWLPDDRQGFIFPAWRKARELVRRGGRIIYSTAPPFSPHLVGLALRSMKGVKWVMELRDPWSDNDQKPWWVRTRVTDALDVRLEARCLRRADLVVAVSEGIRRRLAARFPAGKGGRVLLVRNGIEHVATVGAARRRPGPIRIVYAGSFYHSRDPRPFLRAVAAVCHKRGLGSMQLRVDFIGACRSIGGISVEDEIQILGLADVVHIQDWLAHAAVKSVLEEADVLLLLARQQADQVPNKLYDYLGTRRRILAFADAGGETACMLQQVGGGHQVVTGDSAAEVEQALENVLGAGPVEHDAAIADAVLTEWTTETQMKRLIMAVRGVVQ